jgi:glycine betaine/proline transport system substrate-binding protein
MSVFLRAVAVAAGLLAAAPAMAATVVIGVPNWPSARVTAHVIADLMEDHYDVATRLRPIGTVQLLGAMDRGEVDVHPEIWLPNLEGLVHTYTQERGTVRLADHGVTARQGLCTTRQTAEATGLRSVTDLTDPEVAARFDTDGDGLGEMWIGHPTWSSTRVERVRAASYGYDETMTLITGPEDMAMASVDAAVATGAPVVFYCYAPHYMFRLHDIVRLEEPPHDPENWTIVLPEEDPAWLARSRAKSAWRPSRFHIGYAADLATHDPAIAGFLERVTLTADDAEGMSYAILVERKTPEEVATAFIEDNKDRIEEWIK